MSTNITVTVKDGKVRLSLKRIGDAVPKLTKKRLKAAMQGARDEARQYPPELPNQSYRRTGKYGRSFRLRDNGGRSYTLSSDAVQKGRHYTSYVGGNYKGEGQAQVHGGRWTVIADAVKRWAETLTKEIRAELSRVLRGEGIGL